MKQKVRTKEPLWFLPIKFFAGLIIKHVYGFKFDKNSGLKKNEQFIILSNHQTDIDPAFLRLAVNKYFYILSSDNIFSKKLISKFLTSLGAIPKRKGVPDFESIKRLLEVAKDGGNIAIFPEGNRSYAEFQFYIAPNFASLLKKLKLTIVLYNIHGGFGSFPRFSKSRRKGKLWGEVKRILRYEEYKDMDVEVLTELIKENLKVFDSDSGELYKSEQRAEYLERMFFVCPKCGKLHTLKSEGNFISCSSCGLKVEYLENLTLKSEDKDFKFHRLIDWYEYQKEVIRNLEINDELIFSDPDVELALVNPYKPYKVLAKGELKLYKDKIMVNDYTLDVSGVLSASPMSGRKLCLTHNGDNYQFKGNERFNALKYAFIFHRLDTKMHRESLDNYYNIE